MLLNPYRFGPVGVGGFDVLTHLDGTNGSTTFTEEHGKAVTRNGSLITISTAQKKFGTASGIFPGTTSNNLTIPITNSSSISDFAIGAWFWIDPTGTGNRAILSLGGVAIELYINSSGQLVFWGGSSNLLTSAGAVSTSAWHLVWLERVGSTARFTLDGANVGAGTVTYSGAFTSTLIYIGTYTNAAESFKGYIDEVAVRIGSTVYGGSTFTPPTVPFSP